MYVVSYIDSIIPAVYTIYGRMRVRTRVFYTHDVTIIFCTTYVRTAQCALRTYANSAHKLLFSWTVTIFFALSSAMSLSEELIAAAKSGNAREVRKLLDRRAPFTKDQVSSLSFYVYRLLRLSNAMCIVHIQLCDEFHVLKINATFLHCIVRQHGSARGCVERQQRHCEGSAK